MHKKLVEKKNGQLVEKRQLGQYLASNVNHLFVTGTQRLAVEITPGRQYEPGCCVGDYCPDETRCSLDCPTKPYPCSTTRDDRTSIACVQCDNGPNGEELYVAANSSYSINCLDDINGNR